MNNLTAALAKASPAGYGEAGTRISGAVAVVGTLFSALLGGWDGMIRALIFFMAFDFLSGIAAACREHRLDSQVMFWGGVGKVMVLALVAAGVVLDGLLGLPEPYCRTAIIWFYVGREGLSILENYGKLGLPLPAFLSGLLKQLQDRGDKPADDAGGDPRGGGGADVLPAGAQLLTLPIQRMAATAGWKNAKYLARFGFAHYGIDAVSETGAREVYALGNGTVLAAGLDGTAGDYSGLGWVTVIRYDKVYLPGTGEVRDLIATTFHHEPHSVKVKVGDKVVAGMVIAQYGNTGGTTQPDGSRMGAHLHLQLDADTAYPLYCSGISGKGSRLLKRGTADSTVNPYQALVVGEGQRVYTRDAGWAEDWAKLPKAGDFAAQEAGVSLDEYRAAVARAEAAEAKNAALEEKIRAARAALG